MPSLMLSVVMGLVVYSVKLMVLSAWLTLLIQVCVGVIIYMVLAQIFKIETSIYLFNTLKSVLEFSRNKRKSKINFCLQNLFFVFCIQSAIIK